MGSERIVTACEGYLKVLFALLRSGEVSTVANSDVKDRIYSPFLTCRLLHPYHLDESICRFSGLWCMFALKMYFA